MACTPNVGVSARQAWPVNREPGGFILLKTFGLNKPPSHSSMNIFLPLKFVDGDL